MKSAVNRSTSLALLVALLALSLHGVVAADSGALVRKVLQVTAKADNGVLISIPRTALIERDGIPGVFVVENNEARFRMVRPGKVRAKQVEILSGLFGGESLLADNLDAVHDGSAIQPVQ